MCFIVLLKFCILFPIGQLALKSNRISEDQKQVQLTAVPPEAKANKCLNTQKKMAFFNQSVLF